MKKSFLLFFAGLFTQLVNAQDANLKIPDLHSAVFFNGSIDGWHLLLYCSVIILVTLSLGLLMRHGVKIIKAHESMTKVSEIIYETCKTYLKKQGKYLMILFVLTFSVIIFYLVQMKFSTWSLPTTTMFVLLFSLIGIGGSYAVAWYGIRLNTWANSRTAFASLKKNPWEIVKIPLQSGMSIGLFLISLELVMMVAILLLVPREIVTYCFLGFAIGESLGASVLRLAGGIFTKIADIGADLMKIIFKVGEDDPRNPAVIADCTGDNAGDSIGPTADFFESYGVTGVALISFIVLAIPDIHLQAKLIVWIFAMRFVMDVFSGISYYINQAISVRKYRGNKDFDFEQPLMRLIWIAAICCISISFILSYFLIGNMAQGLWWKLAGIISCGTLAAVLIPEATKIFTSPKSTHVNEIVTAGREGGASLVTLSGIVAGAFSAYWEGILILGIMMMGVFFGGLPGMEQIPYAPVFSLGLVAFGLLCMGPVSIAVDSYGPVSDNAQSIYELSQIEKIDGISEEIKRDFGFTPDFVKSKEYLERNDGCGNTFKASVKPVLIATAVSGATIMIFSIIFLLKKVGMLNLSLTEPMVLFGLIAGAASVFWFTGASIQAVTTGAYRATEFVKTHLDLTKTEASIEDTKRVVEICTDYAQKGALNIFIVIFTSTLAFAFFNPNFFIAYLFGLAVTGLFQAIYMANAGGAWDNAKKVVEVDLKEKNTPLHEATIVGDTIGDPFKDTTSVSLNPIIKFSTLFGLLGIEIAVSLSSSVNGVSHYSLVHWIISGVLFAISLFFIWKSFYGMRIPVKETVVAAEVEE
jgi:K(+)-stimulated pyrophosphate-energized sodium pump